MSAKHPIIAVTGSSGAGTTVTGRIFDKIFAEEKISAALVAGDSFHRFTREEMRAIAEAGKHGEHNHFSVAANHIDKLESLFLDYASTGIGHYRDYIHDDDAELVNLGLRPGTFTDWKSLPAETDLLLYEGLHGGLVTDTYDVAQFVDLLIGVVPIVNLEWIQKIYRDTHYRGYSEEAVVDTIIKRMDDYVRYIVPQFSQTHINFQRVPTVDTSNPFVMREIPTDDESMVVIHFKNYRSIDFSYLLQMIQGAFASRHDTLVVPGNKLSMAVDLIIRPLVLELMENRKYA